MTLTYSESVDQVKKILPGTYRFRMHDRVTWHAPHDGKPRSGSIIGYPGRASFSPECSLAEDGRTGLVCMPEIAISFESPLVELSRALEDAE